jgi:hypothetical protein
MFFVDQAYVFVKLEERVSSGDKTYNFVCCRAML